MSISHKKTKICLVIIFLFVLFFPIRPLNAQIIITEVMYNPEGTDSGREWVEIYNLGPNNIDLSEYKILENGVNHKISPHNIDDLDNLILEVEKYAIISDNSTKFLSDYSENGLLIDSVFSLKNTGEEVSVVNSTGDIVNTFNYSPDLGADGTGNSLQLINLSNNTSDEDWITADPTPFLPNKTEPEDETLGNSDSGEQNDSSSGSGGSSNNGSTHSSVSEILIYNPKPKLKVSAGRDRNVTVNSTVNFINQHNQNSNKGLKSVWSMGDGAYLKGNSVEYAYRNSGVYNVVLNTSFQKESAVSRTKVYVSDPDISITCLNCGKTVDVLLKNNSKNEVNIGDFYLKYSNINNSNSGKIKSKRFKIAKDTILDPGQEIVLDSNVTNFKFSEINLANLTPESTLNFYYPNGEKIKKLDLKRNLYEEDILDIALQIQSALEKGD